MRINVKFAVGQATMHVANRRKDYVPLISKERERVLSLYHYVHSWAREEMHEYHGSEWESGN